MTIDEFRGLLFRTLRDMDREATSQSYYKGILYPTGLREFGAHVKPNDNPSRDSRYSYEDDLTRELDTRFGKCGLTSAKFPRYANGEIADLEVHLSGPKRLWVEVKCAWTYNLHPTVRPNPPYLKHLYRDAKESAAKDFKKLRNSPADILGVLLVGFDIEHGMMISDHDISEMKSHGEVVHDNWLEHYEAWRDVHNAASTNGATRVRCWFWHRAARI